MNHLIKYFLNRPLVTNVIMVGTILAGIALWSKIGKEERPEFSYNFVRATIRYPGASANDVELFVLRPVEEQLKGVTGLYEVNTSSAFGRANIRITLNPNTDDDQEKIQEIKDAIDRADLPSEVEDPSFRRFSSSEKAIIDIAIYLEGKKILSVADRQQLQEYALTFKNRLLSLKEVSGVQESGYLRPELQIMVDQNKLERYEVSMSSVADQIRRQHIQTPLGVMQNKQESEVSLNSFLDTVDNLNGTVVRNTLQQQKVLLEDVAKVQEGFERSTSYRKIQAHEAVIYNAQKSSHVGILVARKAINKLIEEFRRDNEGNAVRIKTLDDESYDIRNRLYLIATNGILGFFVILLILFLFLDFKSGFWVAMGLPFTLAFTLIACMLAGYTVNNITLAAVIIVLGIVVDDAIIVADQIKQNQTMSEDDLEAVASGTSSVFLPILASILTTCAAFIPLYFFTGRFGLFVKFMPFVIFSMLFASLFESLFILPSHMRGKQKKKTPAPWVAGIDKMRQKVLGAIENIYVSIMHVLFKMRPLVILIVFGMLAFTVYTFKDKMKFVMFPREESKEFGVKVIGPEKATRLEMARLVEKLEEILINDKFKVVIGVRTVVGESRRGGEVQENQANLRVELLPPDERAVPLSEMMDYWKSEAMKIEGFQKVRFLESWWGSGGGSPIAIEVKENNDAKRAKVLDKLKLELEKISDLKNVEIEQPLVKESYQLDLNKSEAISLGINPAEIATSLRSYIQGSILYRINNGEEEVDVRLTTPDTSKESIEKILQMKISNQENYFVPIGQLVTMNKVSRPTSINRVNFKRASSIYADMDQSAKKTPLEIATYLEENVFPKILRESPSTIFNFRGEIEDSRESSSDFSLAIWMVVILIYLLLVFLFSSLTLPLVIATALPFGAVGVVWAFLGHGLDRYGFFAVIGTLGMLGVVVNDSIVLVDKFESELLGKFNLQDYIGRIISTAKSRLRPVILTTLTTVAGVFPTAYGLGGYDSMLADMMLAMGWGLLFGTAITLVIVPIFYSYYSHWRSFFEKEASV